MPGSVQALLFSRTSPYAIHAVLCAGVQQAVAVEYRQIPALNVGMPAGSKLLLVNPAVRRGMLLLQKEHVVLLGGVVSQMLWMCEQH
jgi:hypothetical protein